MLSLLHGSWVGCWALILGDASLVRRCEFIHQTPASWSSLLRKAAQLASIFWAVEGYCRVLQNITLYVAKQKQKKGNITKLRIEGPVMRKNHSPKQALSSLCWTSSVYFYWNAQHPWGAWATCSLKALVVTFFSGSQLQWHLRREECITLHSLHWGTGILATQTQRKRFQGNLFTTFPLCTPSWTHHPLEENGFL